MTLNSKKNNQKNDVSKALLNGLKTIAKRRKTPWAGTMTELNNTLLTVMGNRVPENWPGSPSALRVVFNRVIRRVRSEGISVRFTRSTDHMRTRLVQFSTR